MVLVGKTFKDVKHLVIAGSSIRRGDPLYLNRCLDCFGCPRNDTVTSGLLRLTAQNPKLRMTHFFPLNKAIFVFVIILTLIGLIILIMAQIPIKIKKGRRWSPNRYAYQTVKRYWHRRPFLRTKKTKAL